MGISPDLHTNEREDIRKMIEVAKQVHIDNESEDVENYRFLVVHSRESPKSDKDQKKQCFCPRLIGVSSIDNNRFRTAGYVN